jgi:hypothetical protein
LKGELQRPASVISRFASWVDSVANSSHLYSRRGNHARVNHLFDGGEYTRDIFRGIYDHHDHWPIRGYDVLAVNFGRLTITLHASKHSSAGDAGFPALANNGFVQRLVASFVAFTDVNPE